MNAIVNIIVTMIFVLFLYLLYCSFMLIKIRYWDISRNKAVLEFRMFLIKIYYAYMREIANNITIDELNSQLDSYNALMDDETHSYDYMLHTYCPLKVYNYFKNGEYDEIIKFARSKEEYKESIEEYCD